MLLLKNSWWPEDLTEIYKFKKVPESFARTISKHSEIYMGISGMRTAGNRKNKLHDMKTYDVIADKKRDIYTHRRTFIFTQSAGGPMWPCQQPSSHFCQIASIHPIISMQVQEARRKNCIIVLRCQAQIVVYQGLHGYYDMQKKRVKTMAWSDVAILTNFT